MGFDSNLEEKAHRSKTKYEHLINKQSQYYDTVYLCSEVILKRQNLFHDSGQPNGFLPNYFKNRAEYEESVESFTQQFHKFSQRAKKFFVAQFF